jgi:hypothetical protein
MKPADHLVWFVGDLDDPWVASLADALPAAARRFACAGDLPDEWPDDESGPPTSVAVPRVMVVHRAWLSPHDAERLARLRGTLGGETPRPQVILCFGPNVRHADLERWSARGLIDAIVPEATARDTIARHLAFAELIDVQRRPGLPRPRVAVVSASSELRRTLADSCEALGYRAEPASDWCEATATGPAIWDAPVLEPDWPRALARRARLGGVVVLCSFASRTIVGQARAQGASACLELPYDLLDLGHVLARVTAPLGEPAHAVPPRPVSSRRRSETTAAAKKNQDPDRPPVASPGPAA